MKGLHVKIGESNGDPRCTVEAICDGRSIHSDKFDPLVAFHRERFADATFRKLPDAITTPYIRFEGDWTKNVKNQIEEAVRVAANPDSGGAENQEDRLQFISSRELASGDYRPEFHIKGVWVARQPMVIGGAEKSLKTSIVADACISMATATPFLGNYEVPAALNVGILSGESGEGTLQETALRICAARGIKLEDIYSLYWCTDLPNLESLTDVDLLRQRIREHELHVVVVDPAYLAMDLDGRESSMFAVGKLLRRAAKACLDEGASPAIVHHTNSTDEARGFRVPRLQDLAYGGFKQFARQSFLLSRRQPYAAGSGEHRLWGVWGGSLGHGDTIAIDIDEGRFPNRYWQVSLLTEEEARAAAANGDAEHKAKTDSTRKDAEIEADMRAIMQVVVALKKPQIKSAYKSRVKFSGERFSRAWARLADEGHVYEWPKVRVGNNMRETYWTEPVPAEPPPAESKKRRKKKTAKQPKEPTTGQRD